MLSRAAVVAAAIVIDAAVAPPAYASPSGGCSTAGSEDCVHAGGARRGHEGIQPSS